MKFNIKIIYKMPKSTIQKVFRIEIELPPEAELKQILTPIGAITDET